MRTGHNESWLLTDADCAGLGAVCLPNADGNNFCVKTELREVLLNQSNQTNLDLDCSILAGYCSETSKCVDEEKDGILWANACLWVQ